MKNKGFTLIELLAVILILAIIALIAIPAVTNVIEDSKKHASEVTAMSYIKAIDDQNALYKLQPDKFTPITSGNVGDLTVNIKGDAPTEGTVTIANGKVTEASLCANGYTVTYNGIKSTVGTRCGESSSTPAVVFNGTYEAPQEGDTHKGIVYLNPTDLSIECNASNSVSTTGTKTGCMKFYIFNNSGNTYKIILDHNTTATIAYETSGTYKEYSQASIKTTVDNDTSGWVGNPRLITADEIAHIVGADKEDTIKWSIGKTVSYSNINIETSASSFYFDGSGNTYTGWQTQVATSSNKSRYNWLYDYTDCANFGCNEVVLNIYGYWTSSPVNSASGSSAWVVQKCGQLYFGDVASSIFYGIRPVIELSKSYFN